MHDVPLELTTKTRTGRSYLAATEKMDHILVLLCAYPLTLSFTLLTNFYRRFLG